MTALIHLPTPADGRAGGRAGGLSMGGGGWRARGGWMGGWQRAGYLWTGQIAVSPLLNHKQEFRGENALRLPQIRRPATKIQTSLGNLTNRYQGNSSQGKPTTSQFKSTFFLDFHIFSNTHPNRPA